MENMNSESDGSDVLVRVEGVAKKFCRDLKKSLWYGLKDVACEFNPFAKAKPAANSGELRPGEFWAVNGVSFELRRGECLGLVGHNGAGKTTLLKMLNGLIKPDSGSITMRGRVGALIALGAGFNPILSGRENIYVNGSILGLTREEMDDKVEAIIDFAEIREFIDAPVQSYSSGMQVRLGFAVATAMKPDVLILDEVLAVGDAAFRAKCFKRIGSLARDCAIIFVSHDQSQVSRICTRSLLMARGTPLYLGATARALELYHEQQFNSATTAATVQTHDCIEAFEVVQSEMPESVQAGEALELQLRFSCTEALATGIGLINFVDPSGNTVGQADFSSQLGPVPAGVSVLRINLERVDLAHATYTLNIAIFADNRRETIVHAGACARLKVEGAPYLWCAYKMPVREVAFTPSHILSNAVIL